MKRISCLALGLTLSGLALAGPAEEAPARDPRALAILEQVDRAAKAVHAVRYRGNSKPQGVATEFTSAAEGEAVMVGHKGLLPEKFYAHIKTERDGEPVEITGGGNGDEYFLIDHGTRKAYADMDPNVLGTTGRAIQGFWMIEFVHETPFDDELNAERVELSGEETVGGEPCDRIRVVYAGGQGESIWLFSKNDHLPRRRIRKFSMPQGEGSIENTVLELEIDPAVDASQFAFKLPAGYEQVDDFAP